VDTALTPDEPSEQTNSASTRRRLCVLQVLPALEAGGGGVERSAVDVARALVEAGHTSLVASSGGRLVNELTRAGARHFELPLASKSLITIRGNVRRLSSLIEAHNIDVVHARSRAPAWSAMGAVKKLGVPYVTTFHGTYNFTNRLKHKYNSVMVQGDMVIANSHFIADHIQQNYVVDPDRIRVIPRGIDLNRFAPGDVDPDNIMRIGAQWGISTDQPTILLPGRLTRWKGQELTIEALARVARRPLMCALVGADQGRSRYRKQLEAQIEQSGLTDVVRVVGHCDDMPAAYMLADIVVSASTDPEAFGRVVAEAQAMGRMVVAANHGGAAEQIVDGQTGWLFRPGDASDLARTLEQVLNLSPEARDQVATQAMAQVHSLYDKDKMCAATLEVYRELVRT